MINLARILMIFGLILLLIGGVILLIARFGPPLEKIPLGQLPGDIRIERGNFSCFFPIVTSILLSIILTIVLNLIVRFLNR